GHLTGPAAAAARPGGRADGIDPSEPMIQLARRLHGAHDCDFQLGNAEALSCGDATMDVVVSSFAVHHFPETGQQQAIAEVHRILRPGGHVLIADFRPPRHRIPRHLLGILSGHVMRDFPVDKPAELLRQAGFHVTATGDLYPFTRYVSATKP
ncbi:MAG: class I SAM-dependent methyltransferase, partial [Stackebrandtia sp.]